MFSASDTSSSPARPGASYGHRKLQSYSVLSHSGSSEDILSARQQADLNNKHIFKKIGEWFETWRPWQQRMLVCGLTNRCPKNQLEALATVMEPVFHRDFVAALKKRYPSAPFRKMKEMALLREKWRNKRLKEKEKENMRKLMAQLPEIAQEDEALLKELVETCTDFKPNAGADAIQNASSRAISDFAVQYAARVIISSLRTIHPLGDSEEQQIVVMIGDNDLGAHSLGSRQGSLVDEADVKSMPGSENSFSSRHGSKAGSADLQSVHSDSDQNSIKSQTSVNFEGLAKQSVKSSDSGRSEKQRTSQESSHSAEHEYSVDSDFPKSASSHLSRSVDTSSFSRATTAEDPLSSSLPNFDAQMKKKLDAIKPLRALPPLKTPPSATHRHRSAIGASSATSTIDYFMQDTVEKLGFMQREIRVGPVNRPSNMKDLYIPIQKCYKNVKWFGETPCQGKRFVKAHRGRLRKQFKVQLQQIWDWMTGWKDHEKMAVLVEVVKMCDSDLINYMAQCLMQRLKDRTDINRLHDHVILYIFSLLPPDDIERASGVCRRWKYLCSRDDLWMVKCQEMGSEEGVPNITELVTRSNQDNHLGIDWRLAYSELKKITQETRDALPKPDTLSIDNQTPDGMVRVCGKFLPLETEESVTSSSRISRRQSTFQRVRFIDVSSEAELKVRRGTISRLRQEYTVNDDDDVDDDDEEDEEEFENLSVSDEYSLFRSEKDRGSATQVKGKRSVRSMETNAFSLALRHKTERASRGATALTTDTNLDGLDGSMPPGTAASSKEKKKKKRREEDEEEDALDIRPELKQAKDILGRSGSNHVLMWKTSKTSMDPKAKFASFAGEVKGIQRVRKLQGHLDVVLCITFDKKRLFSGSMDRAIRIWDIRSGRSIRKLYGHMGGVRCLRVRGNTLVSSSWDMTAMVWDLIKFERLHTLHGHRGSVSCLEFDNIHLVTGSHDKTVRVWDMVGLSGCKRILRGHKMAITCLAFDGKHVVSGSSDKTIRMTDINTAECLRVFTGLNDHITCMAMSGELILSANSQGQVYFWRKSTGDLEAGVECHKSPINSIVFHQNRFFTASSDAIVKEWDLATMTCVRFLQGHKGPIRDVGASDRYIVTCSDDGNIRIWDMLAAVTADEESTPTEE
ncbi:F-box/WD repeat-containing protein 7-like isoform X2 [Lineus longissimus]|uniref:F-box/WD repeat-containing protein 7-like isoform X2 n=1 Tax=Lineus longissimus TaxID=88925 RepID=UPI00315D1690